MTQESGEATADDYPITTEGQRLLRAVAASNAEVAARVGVSRALVSHWRMGTKTPRPEMRRVLATLYGVPGPAWDKRPPSTAVGTLEPPARPQRPAATQEGPTNREGVEEMLEAILRERGAGGLSVQEFTRLVDAEAKVRKLIHDLDQAERLTETKIVNSEPMRRVRALAFDALEPWPDALKAFVDAIGEATE